MDDATQILNTLDNRRITQRDYSDVQWQYIQDQNAGNYSNVINFNTTVLKPYFIDYHNAYVWLPISIKAQTGVYDGNEALAYRTGILGLINQLIVTTDTGMSLVTENQSPFYINWLRLIIENNTDYFKCNGSYLQMAETIDKWLDVQDTTNVNSFPGNPNRLVADWNTGNHVVGTAAVMNDANRYLVSSAGTSTPTTTYMQSENKFFNPAFKQRIGFFKNTFPFDNNVDDSKKSYDGVVMLPLALLHDFFRQLNMAIINLGFQFQLFLTQPQGTVFNQQVFMTGAGVSSDTVTQPIITYGNTSKKGQGARLYVRNVKFNAADSERMNAKLAENFTKSINFITTDYIPDLSSTSHTFGDGVSSMMFQQQIVSSVVYPLRIWMLCYPDTALTNNDAALRWPLTDCPFILNQANVLINGVPYWKNPLIWPHDHWEMLKDQMPSIGGSIITYNDYVRFGSIMCFDIQRLGLERITSPTEPVSLSVQGQLERLPGNLYSSCKVIYLIERMNEITFSFGSTTTSLVIGNISLNNTA